MTSQLGHCAPEAQSTEFPRKQDDLRGALRRARSRVVELEAELARGARGPDEIVHLVSHELRTPITVISGFGRLLENQVQGPLNEEQGRFVSEILKACHRLDQFVGDLLEAQREGGSPFVVVTSANDLHETLIEQLDSLAPAILERGVKVELRLCSAKTDLRFDVRRIEQVISNLVTNALRYGRDAGVIRVETRTFGPEENAATGFDGGRGGLAVSVSDDGPGIPEADRERLFAPFVRGDAATSDGSDEAGLGIGLAISRRIVEAHGGRIWAESSEFGGARFVFALPWSNLADGED